MKVVTQEINSGQDFFKVKFSNLNQIGQSLDKISFEDCVFENCNFSEAIFCESSFLDCSFKNSDLSMVDLSSSTFSNIDFKDCKLVGIKWKNIGKGFLPISLKFNDSILDYSSFNSLEIEDFKIISCSAKEVDFREAQLKKSDFSGTDLEGAIFHKTNLEKSDFRGSKNYLINFNNNELKGSSHSIEGALNLLKPLKIKIEDFND